MDRVSDRDHLLEQLGLLLVTPRGIDDDDIESFCSPARQGEARRRQQLVSSRSSFPLPPRRPVQGSTRLLTLFELSDTLPGDLNWIRLSVGSEEGDLCLCRVLLELVERSGPEGVCTDETRLESSPRVVNGELGAGRGLSCSLDSYCHEYV